jgi:hypothetical protein
MENEYNNLSSLLGGAIQAMATRPQKTSALTTTSAVQTPYALDDLLAMRDKIGSSTERLNEALKARETLGYSLASALGAIPQQQGAGSWLSDLARGFGAGATARTNAAIDRAQKVYEAEMKDLANRAALDKAMGDIKNQVQEQEMGYTPMEYGTNGKGTTEQVSPQKEASQMEITGGNLADLYQTIAKNPITFSTVGGAKLTEEPRALRSAVTTKGITDMGHREFMYLNSIMPKGFATTINTAAEQKIMRPYTTEFEQGTGSAKKASIVNMMGDIYDAYKNEAEAQGLKMPMSKQEYINQRLKAGRAYNPKYYTGESNQMYETDEAGEPSQSVREYDAAEAFMRGTI